jgi:hypothetical protein
MSENRRAELGMDGDCGFALLGDDLQVGEAEFVKIRDVSTWPDGWTMTTAEIVAAKAAFRRLQARCPGDYSFYFGRSHPYGN